MGIKRSVLTDEKELPLAVVLFGANTHDTKLLEETLDHIVVLRPKTDEAGLLSPVYTFTDRGGCWFCPNAKRAELRHLYDHHPDLWGRMMALQAIPGKTTEKFNRTQKFSDIDAIFRQEDEDAAQAAA